MSNTKERRRELEQAHPKAVMFINLIGILLVFALLVSCIGWRVQVVREHKAEEAVQLAWDQQKAEAEALEQQRIAKELAEQKALAEQQLYDTTLMAKLLAGINGFVDNY